MKVPWRKVFSWHCNACGKCCSEYRVRLSAYEYLKLKETGFVEEKNGRFFIRKIRGSCPFQIDRLCILQDKLKPFACKIYPFSVYKRGEEDALFEYEKEEYYVYVDVFCPNLKLRRESGENYSIRALVEEAVKLYLGEVAQPKKLTADLKVSELQQHRLHRAKV
ncbi:MAG: YkgJ family cysteine cluster protein [Archaeoglobales archaeon]|nr:YkgJ family cysteine cluster protein [Archaeoglobales archaeon]